MPTQSTEDQSPLRDEDQGADATIELSYFSDPSAQESMIDALRNGGVGQAIVSYAGMGDDGSILDVTMMGGGQTITNSELRRQVKDFADELQEEFAEGYENLRGGDVTIVIDADSGRIEIEHNTNCDPIQGDLVIDEADISEEENRDLARRFRPIFMAMEKCGARYMMAPYRYRDGSESRAICEDIVFAASSDLGVELQEGAHEPELLTASSDLYHKVMGELMAQGVPVEDQIESFAQEDDGFYNPQEGGGGWFLFDTQSTAIKCGKWSYEDSAESVTYTIGSPEEARAREAVHQSEFTRVRA